MIIAPLLKLRQKLQNKRNHILHDEEKPFLDHLEDLRKTVTRIVLTLVISVILCFFFNKWFFQLMNEPAVAAGLSVPRERMLPETINKLDSKLQQDAWMKVHEAARGALLLEGEEREIFLKHAAPDAATRHMALALVAHHFSAMLPEGDRAAYAAESLARLPPQDHAPAVAFLEELRAAKTSPDLDTPVATVQMEALAPAEGFMLSMKLSLFAGIIVSFPLLLYFLLEFILPGLTQRERKVLWPSLCIGFGLFLLGVLFAYFFVIPRALEFFNDYSFEVGIKDSWRIGPYIAFVTTFSLIFGVAFELPVVVMVLVKLGLLGFEVMNRTRSYAVIGIMVASAVLTPTGDMFTMSLLGAPMVIMYEMCIWLAYFHEKKQRRLEEEENARDLSRRATLMGVATVEAASHSPHDPYAPQEPNIVEADIVPESPHPHHPDPQTSDADADYAQYLRDHAAMHDHDHGHDHYHTHAENTPVEERPVTPFPHEEPTPQPSASEEKPTPRRKD